MDACLPIPQYSLRTGWCTFFRMHSGDYNPTSGAKRISSHDRHRTYGVVDQRLVYKARSGKIWVDAQPAKRPTRKKSKTQKLQLRQPKWLWLGSDT